MYASIRRYPATEVDELMRRVEAGFVPIVSGVPGFVAYNVAHIETRGGHCGEWEGIAPTGIQWTNTGFELFRFADGVIVSFSMLFDVLNHLKQLGATITPSAKIGRGVALVPAIVQ